MWVSIPMSRRTSLEHWNQWAEQPSTQSEVKCDHTVSNRDTFLASSFSLAETICQVLVTSSLSIFSFRVNPNSLMSIWRAVLCYSVIARSSVYSFSNEFWQIQISQTFSLFCNSTRRFSFCDFLFLAQTAENPAINFFVFWRGSFQEPWVNCFHCDLPLLGHTCMQTDWNYACHWNWLEYHVFL